MQKKCIENGKQNSKTKYVFLNDSEKYCEGNVKRTLNKGVKEILKFYTIEQLLSF